MALRDCLVDFLSRAYGSDWGYAGGMKPTPGFIPGAKTYPPYEEEIVPEGKFSLVDTYFGKSASGGLSIVSVNSLPTLMIQYSGGETWRAVEQGQVKEINAFLREVLHKCNTARLPPEENWGEVNTQYALVYIGEKYSYLGQGMGTIWDLRWAEVILRVNPIFFDNFRMPFRDFFATLAINGPQGDLSSAVFHHVLTHQRIT